MQLIATQEGTPIEGGGSESSKSQDVAGVRKDKRRPHTKREIAGNYLEFVSVFS